MIKRHPFHHIDDYEPYVGADTIDRVRAKAERLRGIHVAHVNSTYYGGGVAELLSSLTLLMTSVGIRTGWRAIHGPPDFFSITKKMHNALQGANIHLTEMKSEIYEDVIYENALRNHLDHDFVIVHDPQPLPLIEHYRKRGPWIWRCHIDVAHRHEELWNYLVPFIEQYDAAIFTLKEYAQKLKTPQVFFMPAIDPFALKNHEMSEAEIDERLKHYNIQTDLPLVVQISRFDEWKDPQGVIEAFNIARREVDATLVLLGNVATDDPEGETVFESLLDCREERIHVLSVQDSALVNALQRRAAVVLQKSLREGFGLTVAEAMWKNTPVIGGNVGGIRYQIEDGVNGFLVDSVPQAAERIVELLANETLRKEMASKARRSVQQRFLLIRLLEQYLDLFAGFETDYRLATPPETRSR
jgi:trehalose synthase